MSRSRYVYNGNEISISCLWKLGGLIIDPHLELELVKLDAA